MKKLLDLFCGAGGASMGYYKAGFDIVGVDIKHQKRYPFTFVRDDALSYLEKYGKDFDIIHASPPCQQHSKLKYVTGKEYVDLIPEVRELLLKTGKPYIIENVPGAGLINPVTLCGTMFDLKVFRHREFETNFFVEQPEHISHKKLGARVGRCGHREIDKSGFISVAGHFSNLEHARMAMGIEWMSTRELAQAIPPAYTKYIGEYASLV